MNKEDIKSNAFSKYCTFINGDYLKDDLKDKFKIGIFIECDWYLNNNQINYLKYLYIIILLTKLLFLINIFFYKESNLAIQNMQNKTNLALMKMF